MNRLSPRTTVLSGATIGLIAGAAIYGAVSSSATTKAPTASKPASATVAAAQISAAHCATGQKLEKGVCIVHVERTVVVPAPASASDLSGSLPASGAGSLEPGEQDSEGAEQEGQNEAAEPADDAAEHAKDAADHAAENDG